MATIFLAGSYASDFFSQKFFLDDYNQMNNYYKQALFDTEANDAEIQTIRQNLDGLLSLAESLSFFHNISTLF